VPLNYKYRLLPTPAQAHALMASMRLIHWGWNLAVRRERWARQEITLGRTSNLHRFLAEQAALLKPTGPRGANLQRLMTEGNLTEEEALRQLNRDRITQAWRRKRSGLSVEYAGGGASLDVVYSTSVRRDVAQ